MSDDAADYERKTGVSRQKLSRRAISAAVIRMRSVEGITQEQLAQRSGISVSMIRLIEGRHTTPTIETMLGLAAAFGRSVSEFMAIAGL